MREYLAIREFIELLNEDSSENARHEAFAKTLVRRHPQCFLDGDKNTLRLIVETLGMFNWKTVDLNELTRTVDELEGAETDLEQIVRTTLDRCQCVLPLKPEPMVWVLPGEKTAENLQQLNGLDASYNKRSGGIHLVAYPLDGWLEKLPFKLAHEYHHAVRYATNPDLPCSLVVRVVTEGLADHFAGTLFPSEGVRPGFESYTVDEELLAYRFLRENASDPDSRRHQLYLYGKLPLTTLPNYLGYAVADRIVEGFVSSHQVSFQDLLALDSEVILKESTYQPLSRQ